MPLYGTLLKLALKHGPTTAGVVRTVWPHLRDNAAAQARLQAIGTSLTSARRARSPEERLVRTVAVIRGTADGLAQRSEGVGARTRAQGWVRRADSLTDSAGLVRATKGDVRKKRLATLTQEVERLGDEVFAAAVASEVEDVDTAVTESPTPGPAAGAAAGEPDGGAGGARMGPTPDEDPTGARPAGTGPTGASTAP